MKWHKIYELRQNEYAAAHLEVEMERIPLDTAIAKKHAIAVEAVV